jgi:HPt (histidine-containing phosphotransfer) domain-containing protein
MHAEKEKMTMPVCAGNSEDELDAVHDMFGADFAELAALYRDDTPRRIAALRHAHAAGDWAHTAQIAHALGGSSVSIGATRLSALCKALETRTKTGVLDNVEAQVTAIEAEYQRIDERLRSMLA